MDRKIELDLLSEDMFEELLLKVGTDILATAKEAQDKINVMLGRFGIECRLSMTYVHAGQDAEIPALKPEKKKRAPRKKKDANPAQQV
jgi:hypothetical protein